MKKTFFLSTIAATCAVLTLSPSAQATRLPDPGLVMPQPQLVKPLDTFNIVVAGFNAAGSGSGLTAAVDPVFGTTQTFTGDALGNQVLTVTSSETVGATNTSDTITISVPTNFCPTGTTVGSPAAACTSMECDIGGYNAGTDTLDFSLPVTSPTYTGSILYSGGTFALSPAASSVFTNGNMSLETAEGVNAGGTNLATLAIRSFTFTISYPNAVPEPSTLALGGLGLAGCAGVVLRRRRKNA